MLSVKVCRYLSMIFQDDYSVWEIFVPNNAASASADVSRTWVGWTHFLGVGLSRGHRANPKCHRHDLVVVTPRGADDHPPVTKLVSTSPTGCQLGGHGALRR